MNRELALKIVLAVVGSLFLALIYPLAIFMRQKPALSMMLSLHVTLGIFLLLAIRNPLASRSLIAFTAWSSFAHAAGMGTQALRDMIFTWRTDRCGDSRGHRRNLDRVRTSEAAYGRLTYSVAVINHIAE